MVETVEVAALPLAPRNPLPYLQQMKAAESRMKLVSMTQASLNLAGALDDPFIVSTNLLVGRGFRDRLRGGCWCMRPCGPGCAHTPRTIRAAGFGPPITMPAVMAGMSITKRSNDSGVKKGCGCRSGPRHRDRRFTRRGMGGGFPVRRHHRRAADQDRVHRRRAHPRMPGWHGRAVDHRRGSHRRTRPLAADGRSYPAVLRCDNGRELACAAMAEWAEEHVGLHSIPPGQPWRNGYVESFNSRVHDECLNINSFWSLTQARMVISDWKHDYNHCESSDGWSGTGWQG